MTESQFKEVAKRLFRTIDEESTRTLNKDETFEYINFMRNNMYHNKETQKDCEAVWKSIEGKTVVEKKMPNPKKPQYPIFVKEERINFRSLWSLILAAGKEDGCVWIPFEETTEIAREKAIKLAELESRGGEAALLIAK